MPEELAIAALILWGVGWVCVKISEGISDSYGDFKKQQEHKRIQKTEAEKRQWESRKRQLAIDVYIAIPKELSQLRADVSRVEREISIKPARPAASKPYWVKREFIPFEGIQKRNRVQKMYVDDIADILTPNKLTWSSVEEGLVGDRCVYPGSPPKENRQEFQAYPLFKTQLKEAVFKYDSAKVSEEDIKEYFSSEQTEVEEYNTLRAETLSKITLLNEKILEYNKQGETLFDGYLIDCLALEKEELLAFDKARDSYSDACKKQKDYFKNILSGYKNAVKEDVVERLNHVLSGITLPSCIPHSWEIDFNPEERIALVEIALPDVVHRPPVKLVQLKSGSVEKPLNQMEKKDIIPSIHPAILLRVAFEIFRNDLSGTIKLLVLNGWVKFDDPNTGVNTKAYTASLMVEKSQIEQMNLKKIDPLAAFMNLKGKSAGKLVEIIPVTPVMSLDRKDKRFIATSEVLNKLGSETNLASMDWQDFENLIAELFEKEFAKEGAEVRVTQASRDRGVDAVIFDPDPIRGGKIIVQAKRYANTVDVSAVRDLCAVVKKEGAIKGILVTTSTFGGDAYQFANNEPVTLLNGAELLGLLKKHGYTFRINLDEAKKLNQAVLGYKK